MKAAFERKPHRWSWSRIHLNCTPVSPSLFALIPAPPRQGRHGPRVPVFGRATRWRAPPAPLRAHASIAAAKNRSQHTRIPAAVNDRRNPDRTFVRCVRDEIFPHHVKSQWTGGQVRASVPDVR
jgi:hypothetical protein